MNIPDHSHCAICGTPVDVGVELCKKEACAEAKAEALAVKKRSVYLLVAMIAAAVLLSQLI